MPSAAKPASWGMPSYHSALFKMGQGLMCPGHHHNCHVPGAHRATVGFWNRRTLPTCVCVALALRTVVQHPPQHLVWAQILHHHLSGSKSKTRGRDGRSRPGSGRAGWTPLGRFTPQNSSRIPPSSPQFSSADFHFGSWWDWGEGAEATPSYHPVGPSPGGSWVFLLCGAQGAGWPRMQDLAGWGRRGQSRLPMGPQGRIWGGTEFPNSGWGLEGVGHLPYGLLSSYIQGKGVPGVWGLPAETDTHACQPRSRK